MTSAQQKIILYGAGACGGYAIKYLATKGIIPVALVDSDSTKFGTRVEEMSIIPRDEAHRRFPEAQWVACAISRPAATEIREIIRDMGVKTKPLWECIPVHHGLPSRDAMRFVLYLNCVDDATNKELVDQYRFRQTPDYDAQAEPSPKGETYFPGFITHLDDEHFVDCGAADGDTVKAFMERWPKFRHITAFEPDMANFVKLSSVVTPNESTFSFRLEAVCDRYGHTEFSSNGDYSSHVKRFGNTVVECTMLDGLSVQNPPTYIKMDIEGAELEALWGARKIIKEHSPVLAICAYHQSSHLWDIPLLIHALNPEYRLFLRRYAEGAFELVWYAVPPERIKA